MPKRKLKGKVISNKMKKTVVVEIERIKKHKKYKRRFKIHKKFKAHDQNEECKVGDTVIIEECRPLSKEKRWRVIQKTESKVKEQPEEVLPDINQEKKEESASLNPNKEIS